MYFTFKGITSTSMGLVVNSMPTFKKPQRRSDVKLIDGKAGASVTEYGYAPYSLPCKVTLTDTSKLDAIIAWLDGTGTLICSDDPLKYRDVRILDEVDYQRMGDLKETTIEFYVPIPFRKLLNDTQLTVTKAQGTITYANAGTADSYPLLNIGATAAGGPVTVTINGVGITFNFPTEYSYINIDCLSKTIWKDIEGDASYYLLSGVYPKLKPGNNTISISGTNATSVDITKRTSYL